MQQTNFALPALSAARTVPQMVIADTLNFVMPVLRLFLFFLVCLCYKTVDTTSSFSGKRSDWLNVERYLVHKYGNFVSRM